MTAPTGRRTALLVAGGGVLLLVPLVWLGGLVVAAGLPLNPYAVTNLVVGTGYLLPAAVIAWHRPRTPLVLLLAAGAAGHLLAGIGVVGHTWGPHAGWPSWAVAGCQQLMGLAWRLGLGPPFALLLLLYPDGRLPSPRWRLLVWATGAALAAAVAGWYLAPDSTAANVVVQLADLAVTLAAVVALVLRYRRGDARVRGQILWLVLAVLVILVLNAQRAVVGRGPELLLLSFVAVPAAIAVGVLRHGLLDIRLVVSRTLLYGALVALVLTGYAGLVALAARLLPADLAGWGPVTSALAVALALDPVRVRLQRLVTRALYGRRDEPATALLDVRLGDAGDLAEVLDQVRSTLRLPALAVLDGDGLPVARSGPDAEGRTVEHLPLTSRGQVLGHLVVTLRAGESRLHRRDAVALGVLAGPLALLLREQALAGQLRASRAQVVRARESERSLLHRDLHDGLGPTLTNAAFRADAAAHRIEADPAAAAVLLDDVRAGVREALADVRRVVYGLRPLALEELGLVGAVREQAARAGRLPVRVDVPRDVPELPPAVELAAYRIATEAIANAQRHSRGSGVDVRVDVDDGELVLLVTDDGPAPGAWSPGVGLRSIGERAEELGGRADVGPGPRGWRVRAWIPCSA